MEITIRAWKPEDAADLALVLNNKKILDNLRDGPPFPYTLSDAKDFIALMLNAEKDSQYAWAIAADDRAVGSIGVFRKDNIHRRTAEMGYYVAEPYWGKGVGTKAVLLACDFIFTHTDIIRIFAEPFATNAPSCRILEKSGFVCEGTLRKNAVKNGAVQDMKMYAIVKDEHDRLRRIKLYKSAIFTIEDEIAQEKNGLILDSGTRLPDVVNTAAIHSLENQLMECRRILAELEEPEKSTY